MDTKSMILLLFSGSRFGRHRTLEYIFKRLSISSKLNDSEMEAIKAFVQARNLWWISSLSKMPEYQHMFDDEFWKSAFSEFETSLLN